MKKLFQNICASRKFNNPQTNFLFNQLFKNNKTGTFALLVFTLATISLFPQTIIAGGGDLDITFGTNGKVMTNVVAGADEGRSVAVQADGKILVAGFTYNGGSTQYDFVLLRYNASGTLDTGFGTGGKVVTAMSAFEDKANAVIVQPDGKILVAGGVSSGNIGLARYTSTGALDNGFFGSGGRVITAVPGGNSEANAILYQPDGKIVVVGNMLNSVNGFLAVRYNTNGSLDTTFGTNGVSRTVVGTGFQVKASDAALQSDGKLVIVGTARTNAQQGDDFSAIRLNANGTLDTSFDTDGRVFTHISSEFEYAKAVGVQPDGKIVVAGYRASPSRQYAVVRYLSNGTLDTGFGTGGIVQIAISGQAGDMEIQSDGKILVAGDEGSSNYNFAMGRLNANGSLDITFGTNGMVSTDFGGAYDQAYALKLQNDGKILVAGTAGNNSTLSFGLARYNNEISATAPGRKALDFDGDGKSDTAVYREGVWHSMQSTQGYKVNQYGISSDMPVPADYDGDGKTDFAVWRSNAPGSAAFYIFESSTNTTRIEIFGQTGDDPTTVGDYDGDGKADPSVYRTNAGGGQSYFYYRGSLNNPSRNITYIPWGSGGDKPVVGDYTGDGKLDVAVFRPADSRWYIQPNGQPNAWYSDWFGLGTDKLVQADYDGDGKTDLAVFRPADQNWYYRQSSNNQVRQMRWGLDTDTPVPADYDGDGKTDIAVWRGGEWLVFGSANSAAVITQFGVNTDIPVQSVFTH